MVAIALGLGTMVGWKRIVVTVGEKIGKDHLTYAQGAAAEITAMVTIGAADVLGLPVSTTHVLSSGVAGTMAANRTGPAVVAPCATSRSRGCSRCPSRSCCQRAALATGARLFLRSDR
jgi:phosphate/sulfate permease